MAQVVFAHRGGRLLCAFATLWAARALAATAGGTAGAQLPFHELPINASYGIREVFGFDEVERTDLRVRYPFDVLITGTIGNETVRLAVNLRLNYSITSFLNRKWGGLLPHISSAMDDLFDRARKTATSPIREITAILDAIVGMLGALAILSFLMRSGVRMWYWVSQRAQQANDQIINAITDEIVRRRKKRGIGLYDPLLDEELERGALIAVRQAQAREPRRSDQYQYTLQQIMNRQSQLRSRVAATLGARLAEDARAERSTHKKRVPEYMALELPPPSTAPAVAPTSAQKGGQPPLEPPAYGVEMGPPYLGLPSLDFSFRYDGTDIARYDDWSQDVSRRARIWIESQTGLSSEEHTAAKRALERWTDAKHALDSEYNRLVSKLHR